MKISNTIDKMVIPEFAIDTVTDVSGKVTPGIKRMYDIAYEIKDSIMQWGAPGCIAGDAVIRGHWAGKNRRTSHKGVRINLIYKHQHDIPYLGSYQIKSKEFVVKAYNELTGYIEETSVTSTYSGKKQCYLVRTENKEVEVTEEHPFLTQRGWVECQDLKDDDVLFVQEDAIQNPNKPTTEKLVSVTKTEVKDTYDLTCKEYHTFFANGILVHNCGKSQGVMQWNAEKVRAYDEKIQNGENVKPWNPVVCDVRLSMKEPVDLVGVPTISVSTKDENGSPVTVWATPSMWPKDDGKYSGGVIHLDEINQGQPAILNAAFQLIQDRGLGEYKVPDGYLIIASSNPSAFNSTVTEFSLPLSNRFSHFNIRPDFESWLNYRMRTGGNTTVMSFLKTEGTDVFCDIKGIESRIGCEIKDTLFNDIIVTPRSWEVVEKVLNLPDSQFNEQEKYLYITGRLGIALATKLFNYIKEANKYQPWQEILESGKEFRDETDMQSYWNTQINCLTKINSEKDDKKLRQYVLNFIEATRKLKSKPYKITNLSALVHCDNLKGRPDMFSAIKDAGDLVSLISVN